jgi:hypothetical protein
MIYSNHSFHIQPTVPLTFAGQSIPLRVFGVFYLQKSVGLTGPILNPCLELSILLFNISQTCTIRVQNVFTINLFRFIC